MYEQRARPRPRSEPVAGLEAWIPASLAATVGTPAEGGYYVVVDDLDPPTVVVVAAPWPHVDPHGRLVFGDRRRREILVFDSDQFHDRIRQERHDHHQDAPDRRLRIGDVFYLAFPSGPDDDWTVAIDVTADARDQAKLAHYAAVTPRVDPVYADAVGLVDPVVKMPGLRRGPGPTAAPTI